MTHLIITIDLPVNESREPITSSEAKEAAKQAYKATRKALPQFTAYNEEDISFKIER